jgi:pimeloyl-ACP methyl ester carboxylesterase
VSDDATAATSEATPRLHVDVHDGEGPYLLLVHGMLSSRVQWMPNLDAFSQFSRPVVVELWGHGRSPTPEQMHHYTPDAYVEQFELLRKELGVERWLICGQSMGASLTLRYVFTHPQRAIAHVFTNTNSGLAEPTNPERMSYWEEQIRRVQEQGRVAIDDHPMNPLLNRKLSPELREQLAADIAGMTTEGFEAMMAHTQPEAPLGHRLGENTVSSLLIVGERETGFAPLREHAERTMPHLETIGLDANHAVNINQAEGFNTAAREFFLRHLNESGEAG